MQLLHGLASSATVRAYANEREILVFIQEMLRQQNMDKRAADYVDALEHVGTCVRDTFGFNITVTALDAVTNREADDTTNNVLIYISTDDRYSQ
jgi:hypothetical protein